MSAPETTPAAASFIIAGSENAKSHQMTVELRRTGLTVGQDRTLGTLSDIDHHHPSVASFLEHL